MPHSEKAYYQAKKAVEMLIEGGLLDRKNELKARGVIQIAIEEN